MDGLPIEWRYFSLEQVNSKQGEEWRVWEQPAADTRSLPAFKGAEAARRQGAEAFDRFHHALLEARHERGETLDRETVKRVAGECGLDTVRFEQDLDAPDILGSLAREHAEAVELGVFGTPTVVFGEDKGAFIRMRPASRGADALRVFESFRQLVTGDLNIQEIKRPGR